LWVAWNMAAKVGLEVNFCIRCGKTLELKEQFGAIRPVCPNCGWIYFADPKVAVAALIERDRDILLVRRANDPQRGLWSLPAGFIDAGEDPVAAVERECLEETGLKVLVTGLLDVIFGQEHPRGAHILIVYRAEAIAGVPHASDDVDRVAYFSRDNMPQLAFSTTIQIIDRWIK
jgi:8-oxo-dGTP diphosphatase